MEIEDHKRDEGEISQISAKKLPGIFVAFEMKFMWRHVISIVLKSHYKFFF
jgi:hypothetical protein